jgi:exodeoxyribonuclease VII small subunit
MAEERDTYEATRARLEEIAVSVRKKDVTLEKSIELLEEGVRLANLCTEQVDQVELASAGAEASSDDPIATSEAAVSDPEPAGAVPGPDSEPHAATEPDPEDVVPPSEPEDEDVLAEAFADVQNDPEREACEGQTEAFDD